MEVYHHRKGLARVRRRLESGQLTVGYVGGSISDPRPGYTWPDMVTRWFVEKFPAVRVVEENAAIGATGSEQAVFRAERELVETGCDLVFIEFAVNDNGDPTEKRRRTREGLVRKLLAGQGRDLVFVYTFGQPMYTDMMAGRVPQSIHEFEELGAHYGIGSVWMGLHALRELQAGHFRWEEWLPDGVHPQYRGSLSYAQSVMAFLERELIEKPSPGMIAAGAQRPKAMDPRNWENAELLPFSKVKFEKGPWAIRRWRHVKGMEQIIETAAVGSRLAFRFEGTGVTLGFDFGKTSSEFLYRVDGGEWKPSQRDRPAWCGNEGWYRNGIIASDLPNRRHHVEIEVVHGNTDECSGTNFRLGMIGVIKS